MKARALFLITLLLWGKAWCTEADLTLQQLNHKGWTLADGAPGAIYAIAQTTDGTLWVGGPSGLSRFDGMHFVRYEAGDAGSTVAVGVSALAAATDGRLWIGYSLGGITLMGPGGVRHYGEQDGLASAAVFSIVTDRKGIPFAATNRGLFALRADKWERVMLVPGNPEARVSAATLDATGALWALTGGRLWARLNGQINFRELTRRNNSRRLGGNALASAPDGKLWVLNLNSIGTIARVDVTDDLGESNVREFAVADTAGNAGIEFDRDGNLWLGGGAVQRVPAAALSGDDLSNASQRVESFTLSNGLTGNSVNCFFQDREGNMWVGTYAGLDKFSHSNVTRVTSEEAITSEDMFGAAVAGDSGAVWVNSVGTETDARYHIIEIRDGIVGQRFPAPHFTSAFRSQDGSIWFGGRDGITQFNAGREMTTIPLPERAPVQAMVQDSAGAMWVSVSGKGVFRLADGHWNSTVPTLPQKRQALAATADSAGRLWFGYRENRLIRIEGNAAQEFGPAAGLKVGNVTAITAPRRNIWIGGDRGLAHFDGTSRFTSVLPAVGDPFTGISGIVELASGDLWLNGNTGIAHVSPQELARLAADPGYHVQTEVFDRLDGLQGYARQVRPSPSAFEGTDGRIWFATQRGLVSIDPTRIHRNALLPQVTIWSVQGTSVQYPVVASVKLPTHTTNVHIDYTASSLTVPERVRFRYKLEGLDKEWQDVGDRREAIYTNLAPGNYSFHVIASNNDGMWNTRGASVAFTIAPAFYQTKWFYGFCAILALLPLRLLYTVRIRQVSAQVRGRLEERLAERERIARELHDTLLQSVQGLVLRFRAAVSRMPHHDPSRLSMEQALDRADGVLTEGRDRVKDLRSSPGGDLDLPQAIAALGEAWAAENPAHFKTTVEGEPRDVHPIVREEALFIAREALANAFTHAKATQIEAEISYRETELRIRVRDDGQGIDSEVLRAGRAGHWGLLGMHERARKIRATLTVWSKPGAGMEVDVRIPAHIAYQITRRLSLRESLALRLS